MYWYNGRLITCCGAVINPDNLVSYDYTGECCIGYTNDGMISYIGRQKLLTSFIYAPDALDIYILVFCSIIVVYADKLEVYSCAGNLTRTINENIGPDFKLFKHLREFCYINNGVLRHSNGTIIPIPHNCKYIAKIYAASSIEYVANDNTFRDTKIDDYIPLTTALCTDQMEVLHNDASEIIVLHCRWSGNTTRIITGLNITGCTFDTNGYHWMITSPNNETYYCAGHQCHKIPAGSVLFDAGRHVRSVPTKSARS